MWEPHTYNAIKARLHCTTGGHEQTDFVDFGSNVGFFSLYALASGCSVLAVDGGAVHLQHLETSVLLNDFSKDRISIHHTFLGPKPGPPVSDFSYGRSVKNERVETTTIDELLKESGQVQFAKLDIEHSVRDALKGASKTLARQQVQTWLVEVWGIDGMLEQAEAFVNAGYHGRFLCCEMTPGKYGKSECPFRTVAELSTLWPVVVPHDLDQCDVLFEL